MRSTFFTAIAVFIALSVSCTDDSIPTGLYKEQVIRLLTNDSSKLWTTSIPVSPECGIADQWVFLLQNDSVSYRSITTSCIDPTSRDTTTVGVFIPSFLDTGFTDSLIFSDGSFWQVSFISSQEFRYFDPSIEQAFSLIPVQ